MTDLTTLTLTEARDGLKKKSFTATELTEAFIKAIETGNGALNAYVLPTPEHALRPGQGLRRPPRQRRRRARSKAFRSATRICSAPTASARPPAPRSSATSCRPINRPSAPISGTPVPSCSANSTTTNSPWARRTRPALSAPSSRPGAARARTARSRTRSSSQAARRAARPPLSPPICASAQPPPIPAARSASLRR